MFRASIEEATRNLKTLLEQVAAGVVVIWDYRFWG